MKAFALTIFFFGASLGAQPAEPVETPADKQNQTTDGQPSTPAVPANPAPADKGLPDASVDVELNVVTNFIDRGEDVGAGYTHQQHRKHDGINTPFFFQPSVTFHTPVEGLFVNVSASVAMRGRTDTDADQRLESGANGNQTILADSVNRFVNTSLLTPYNYITTTVEAAGTYPALGIGTVPVYKLYDDDNGLYRRDQLDISVGYERETKLGILGGGVIASNRLNARGKSNPFGDNGANYQVTEMYASYAFPFFTDLKFTWYGDIVNSDQRFEAEIGHEFELAEAKSVTLSAVSGYSHRANLHGWQDVDLGADFTLHSFVAGLHWVYRPTLAFFDEDTDLTTNWIQFDGLSNRRDGLVTDPRRVGLAQDYINGVATGVVRQQTGNSIYAYTPRQKLPKWLKYATIGYRMSF